MRYPALALVPAALFVGASLALAGQLNEVSTHDRTFNDVDRDYPAMDERYVRQGVSRTPQQLSKLAAGQRAEDVIAILGQPVVTDKAGWHYNVSLPLDGAGELVCQYKLVFDREGALARGMWRRPQCAAIAAQAPGN